MLTGSASGGIVNALTAASRSPIAALRAAYVQRFAKGGFVGTVPGKGNTDSFFAPLEAGSFVLRQKPSQLLAAQRFAAGGKVLPPPSWVLGPKAPPKFGVAESGGADGSFSGILSVIQALPVFERANDISRMFTEAFRLQESSIKNLRNTFPLGYVEPGAEKFSRDLATPKVDRVKDDYFKARARKNSSDAETATGDSIKLAQGIAMPARGLSYAELKDFAEARAADEAEGKARQAALASGMSFEAFLEFVAAAEKKKKEEEKSAKSSDDPPQKPPQKKADGGSLTGTGANIPALLMPEERVFSPQEVRLMGLQRLQAMNRANTREQLQVAMQRYAEGGFVNPSQLDTTQIFHDNLQALMQRSSIGGATTNNNNGGNSTNNQTFNFTVNGGGSDIPIKQLARLLIPHIEDAKKRSK